MVAPAKSLFTIGYEGLVQEQLLELLQAAGVQTVLDVRAVPQSRKAGFSRNILAASLAARGLTYVLDKRLGTPKAGRQAVRAGQTETMRRVFQAHMESETAQSGLAEAVMLSTSSTVCLLCFEREAHDCHRSIVASLIHARTGFSIRHL